MKNILPPVFLLLALITEATFLALPLTLLVLFLWYIKTQNQRIFVFAFIAGFFLDTLLVGEIGLRSLFFVAFIFLLFLYERKFEIQTLPFVFFASFFGSILYGFVFMKEGSILVQALEGSCIAVVFFFLMSSFWGGARDIGRV